jgi:hypothetical protein
MVSSGATFAAGTYITAITGATTFTINQPALAAVTGGTGASTTGASTFSAGSATGLGGVLVTGTGKLGGTGILGPTGSNGVTVDGGAAIAPGNSIGTLTVNLASTSGGITFNNTSKGEFELSTPNASINSITPGSSDLLVVNTATAGDVSFTGTTIDLKNTATGIGFYKLFDTDLTSGNGTTWVGLTLSGQVITGGLTVANVGTGFSGTLLLGDGTTGSYDDIYLQVTAVPEPTSLAVIAMAGMGLLRRRRRMA